MALDDLWELTFINLVYSLKLFGSLKMYTIEVIAWTNPVEPGPQDLRFWSENDIRAGRQLQTRRIDSHYPGRRKHSLAARHRPKRSTE